jgi:diacylglycerol kinase family enzyme
MSPGDAVQAVVLTAALAVAAVLLLLVRRASRRAGQRLTPEPPEQPAEDTPGYRIAVVANPTKILDVDAETAWVTRRCEDLGWGAPLWLETTAEDPGHGQAAAAIAAGAREVVAYGGDGTVRAVATELAGTSVSLGILPAGTGNLLARNLSIPVTDLDAALELALGERERRVDVARAEIDVSGEDHEPRRDTFLVMAGLGFDAEVMASVEPELKERVGWWAYVVTGTRKLTGPRTRVTLRMDDGAPLHRRVRSVLVGNCGELTGGLRLMPEALVDDGWLDVAVVAPRGVVGWGAVIATVLTRSRRGHPVVQHFRCRSIEIQAEQPLHVQLDGDPAGTARVLRAKVDPLALRVRCGGS